MCLLLLFCWLAVGVHCKTINETIDDGSNSLLHGFHARGKEGLFLDYCRKRATCHKMNYTTCMGVKLPYGSSTFELTGLPSEEHVQEMLQSYNYLRYIPKCWAVIQPFLCALYMPKCGDKEVDLPPKEMCHIMQGPCKILYQHGIFPDFMNCDLPQLSRQHCKNDIQELKFNTTGFCMEPLVKTDQSYWFYPDVEGCGLRCKDPFYTETEHNQIHKLVAYCAISCIILNLFTVITFIIDWKTANKYPALAIFYINLCFFISFCGWFVQFLGSETREDVICKKDGTLRKSEPSASENLSCVAVFVLVYYFLIAAMVWFVIFSYAWYLSSLQALGKIQDRVDKKRAYFHLVAWSIPLILTITTMAVGEIDGDYVTGICFVGMVNPIARIGLLLVPLAISMILFCYITVRGLILLVRVRVASKDIISEHSSSKIRSNIVRMGVFGMFMFLFCVITFQYHIYVFANSESWKNSLHQYIMCKLTSLNSDFSHCRQKNRPSVAMLQLQLLSVFGSGLAVASWVWCAPTLHAWARYMRKKFHCEVEGPMKLQKHKIIAQAFAKRRIFNEGGRISINCQSHTDPVGLHFELNSAAASNDLSSTWAANLTRLVNRRGAVPNDAVYAGSSNNHSVDSELSVSVRHVGIESRRNSGDSQLSVQIAELKATRKVNGRGHRRMRHKHDFRRSSRDRKPPRTSRRGSSTSLDSHLGARILNALTGPTETTAAHKKTSARNLKQRRAANAGLFDGQQHINSLLVAKGGKLVIPYGVRSGSEDENVSVTISESRYSVVVNNHNLDLNDELVMKSLRHGLHIDSTSTDEGEVGGGGGGGEQVERASRGSRNSRRSRRSRRSRVKYSSDSGEGEGESSSCAELKQLMQVE